MTDSSPTRTPEHASPFERIRRVNDSGSEFWSSRDFATVLGYTDYRNFEQVIGKAKTACFNSGVRIEDHFVDVTEMVAIGSGRATRRHRLPFARCLLPDYSECGPAQGNCGWARRISRFRRGGRN